MGCIPFHWSEIMDQLGPNMGVSADLMMNETQCLHAKAHQFV